MGLRIDLIFVLGISAMRAVFLSGMSGRWMQADVVPGLFDTDIEDGEGLYFVMDGMAGRVLISGTTIIERS